ncbi:unnamed protein product [Clavelina lepadiformis]|uniref:FAD-binding FR-type domain-containing protein n=1 Tax=Clavelina lepadiformis TaxID=159417 RepID=A0ABP0FSM5_CLALP
MSRLSGLLANELPKYLVLLIWLGLNVFLFVYYYLFYDTRPEFFYTRILLGPALALARAPAACLNLNCMLVLLPICRNLLSRFRRACMCCPRRVRVVLDKNIKFHRLCAYMIVLMTLIHYYAHCFNVDFFTSVYRVPLNSRNTTTVSKLRWRLTQIGGNNYLNPIRSDVWSVGAVFLLTGGWTGVIITLSLFFMVTSSVELIRRSYFEVFWYTHHLFVVFYGFLVVHGISRQVRGQTPASLQNHNVTFCSQHPDLWPNPPCPLPVFQGSEPMTWKWVIAPMILYVIERIIRFVRFTQHVEILKVIKHPSRVVEIQMRKSGFFAEVGQYVFIMCPKLSNLEWHPFTLTSAPEENYCSVHIRIVGGWTSDLSKALGADGEGPEVLPSWKMPRIAVDGPFGTASEDVFTYPVAICVGSGIGVTPFASLLKSVWYKNLNPEKELALKKVYFFWICPEVHAFEWFGDMLTHLEQQLIETGQQNLIEYNIYLTRGWDAKQAKTIMVHEEDERDVITGLEQKTNYGRPNWDDIFMKVAQTHPSTHVGVFFCGVAALSHELHRMSNKHSGNGVVFHYNKENF